MKFWGTVAGVLRSRWRSADEIPTEDTPRGHRSEDAPRDETRLARYRQELVNALNAIRIQDAPQKDWDFLASLVHTRPDKIVISQVRDLWSAEEEPGIIDGLLRKAEHEIPIFFAAKFYDLDSEPGDSRYTGEWKAHEWRRRQEEWRNSGFPEYREKTILQNCWEIGRTIAALGPNVIPQLVRQLDAQAVIVEEQAATHYRVVLGFNDGEYVAVVAALGLLKAADATPRFSHLLLLENAFSSHPAMKHATISALGLIEDPQALPALQHVYESSASDRGDKRRALEALIRLGWIEE
jgi:hypothetical protein